MPLPAPPDSDEVSQVQVAYVTSLDREGVIRLGTDSRRQLASSGGVVVQCQERGQVIRYAWADERPLVRLSKGRVTSLQSPRPIFFAIAFSHPNPLCLPE